MVLLWIVIPIFIAYSILIFYYWKSWASIPEYIAEPFTPKTKISVIVPARNEEANIGALLTALQHQSYPKELTEIIVVDDHSEDNTADIVKDFDNVQLVTLRNDSINSFKKKAIEMGIASANGQLIVATDADCVPAVNWLQTISSFHQTNGVVFIAAPVDIRCDSSFVQLFQAMDFMVLQGITGAGVYKKKISMCNGANVAYLRSAFEEVEGFKGIDHIASGDDMLLMYKIWKKHPEKVHYLKSKDAIVSTQPVKTWGEFFNQRIRWASKARSYDDKRILPVLTLVYFLNLLFPLLIIAGFIEKDYWIAAFVFWVAKTLVELPLYWSLANYFNKTWTLKWFFFFQPLHLAYTLISGLLGQFGMYNWKGRRVR